MVISSPPSISQKYGSTFFGSTFFPIFTDLAVYAQLSRVTTSAKAQLASLVVGLGVSIICARRTNRLIGLGSAGLYLAYKVIAYFYLSHLKSAKYTSIEDLKQSALQLHKKFIFVSELKVDATDSEYKNNLKTVKDEFKDVAHLQWGKPDLLQETVLILARAQAILFKIYNALEEQTVDLKPDPAARLTMMASLLNMSHINPDRKFDRALSLLNETYRFARSMSYHVSLPHLQNAAEDQKHLLIFGRPSEKECEAFILGSGPEREMNVIYNSTQNRLEPLLKLLYPHSMENVKDEQAFPADYGGVPANPFLILGKNMPVL